MSYLKDITCVSDVKKLKEKELPFLCSEIRDRIIETVNDNGGHLSSNLGVVELTVALYYVFDFPTDKLVFDVGHQCYAHKILSGRNQDFSSLRTEGGLSGFPDDKESEFDSFTSGHAGSSIAQSLGLCTSRDKLKNDFFVINLVGDGSLVNGLNLEAISARNVKPRKYILILNDNEMSISKNNNGFYNFISRGTTKKGYLRFKRFLKKVFGASFVTKFFIKVRNFIKRIFNRNYYLEKFGFKYVSLPEGNDVVSLVKELRRIKEVAKERAVLFHVNTVKGKGLEVAEKSPDLYHGVGKRLEIKDADFSLAFGKAIEDLIEKDDKIVAITAGMENGTGLKKVAERFPKNVIDVGIAEELAVTYASGLAKGGLKPVVAIYSTFIQRAYDEIISDVCLSKIPVVFCLDRSGLVGADGKTHQGVFDLSFLTHIPNMKVFAPGSVEELSSVLSYALSLSSPVAIRYPNGSPSKFTFKTKIGDSLWDEVVHGENVNILAVGPRMIELALKINQDYPFVGVINARSVKPLDTQFIDSLSGTVITMEENAVIGGFGSFVSEYLKTNGKDVKVLSYGIKDEFVEHGSVLGQMEKNLLTRSDIVSDLIKKGVIKANV